MHGSVERGKQAISHVDPIACSSPFASHFYLAFPPHQRDESSCAKTSAERMNPTTMTNAKANTAIAVAPQGATTAPEKAPATKEATSKKATPQGRKTARPRKTKKGKGGKKAAPARKAKAPET